MLFFCKTKGNFFLHLRQQDRNEQGKAYSNSILTAVMNISPSYKSGGCPHGTFNDTQTAAVSLHKQSQIYYKRKKVDTSQISKAQKQYPGWRFTWGLSGSIGTRASGTPKIGTTRRKVMDWPTTNLVQHCYNHRNRTVRMLVFPNKDVLNFKQTNLSPEEEQRSVHCICTDPAIPEVAHETFGRKAIWKLSLSFLAAKRLT